jgi:hypothetical protein
MLAGFHLNKQPAAVLNMHLAVLLVIQFSGNHEISKVAFNLTGSRLRDRQILPRSSCQQPLSINRAHSSHAAHAPMLSCVILAQVGNDKVLTGKDLVRRIQATKVAVLPTRLDLEHFPRHSFSLPSTSCLSCSPS